MNELKRLVSSVTYQLYANVLLRCVLLAASAYLLTVTFTGRRSGQCWLGWLGLAWVPFSTNSIRTKSRRQSGSFTRPLAMWNTVYLC